MTWLRFVRSGHQVVKLHFSQGAHDHEFAQRRIGQEHHHHLARFASTKPLGHPVEDRLQQLAGNRVIQRLREGRPAIDHDRNLVCRFERHPGAKPDIRE